MYDSFEVKKVLIIAPLRVARDTWPAELAKWDHLKNLTYSVAVGSAKERNAALDKQADVYIINRENVQWLVKNRTFDFDMIVIDELSSFKNHQAARFKSLMHVRPKARRIVGLTGTPSSNGLMDLYAEFRVLDMGERLGRFISAYRDRYFRPDKRNGFIVYSYEPLPGAEEMIYEKISDITISMTAADHLQMPDLLTNEVAVKLSADERKRYDTMRHDLMLSIEGGEDITAANAAALSGKLLQMANGAIYDDAGGILKVHDRKLDALEDLIEGANGKPVLIAYWFKHDLKRIKERFKVRELKQAGDIKDWNAGRIPAAVIHPASAGHGLNLQAGGATLIWFGLTWSLELYQQTNARLWRQGQQHTVVIHHIIAENTIDGMVLKALGAKTRMQDGLIRAVKAELGRG